MKVRFGFVANSSSSSFVVAVKEGTDVRSAILDALGIPKTSRMYPFAETIADHVKTNLDTPDDYWFDEEESPYRAKTVLPLRAAGYTIYELRVSSDGDDAIENMLYNNMGMIAMDTDAIKVIP